MCIRKAVSAHKGDLNRCRVPGGTPLMMAVWCNNVDAVMVLVNEGGADPNQANFEGDFTPLCMGALNGYLAVSQTLVSLGADVNLGTPDCGFTPLIMAAAYGQVAAVRLLLHLGADVDLGNDHDGGSALSSAADYGQYDAVKVLLQAHTDVEHRRSTDGSTPLCLAAQSGRTSVVRLLLSEGRADSRATTFGGLTPLDSALVANHRYTAKELQEHELQRCLQDMDCVPHMESSLGLTEHQAAERKHAARRYTVFKVTPTRAFLARKDANDTRYGSVVCSYRDGQYT